MDPALSVVIYVACGVIVFGLLLYSLFKAASEADRESAEWAIESHDEIDQLRRRRLGISEREAQDTFRPHTGALTVAASRPPTRRASAADTASPRSGR